MSQKRQQDDGKAPSEGRGSDEKRQNFGSVVLEVMSMRRDPHWMEPILEPLIRRVVKEEVESALRKYLTSMKWNCEKETESSESRSFQLMFLKSISLPVFTGTRIEGEDSNTLRIALVDSFTGQVVHSEPESSAKVEIVVLEGDFDGDDGGNWTPEEFKNNIIRERIGKKPLLTGDAFLNLKEGIGLVSEISFTDNSSWTRSRKFRLGARIVDNLDGVRVREAKTESFVVKDHRGELYKKHHPPSLTDEVWRLEKIGKDGAFHKRLSQEKVNTVEDFLRLLSLNPTRLKNILGSGMSVKMWEVTIEHARTCVIDPRLYSYSPLGSRQKCVVFNIVGQPKGLFSECCYTPIHKLTENEKDEAHKMVESAFEHWEDVGSFENESSLVDDSVCGSNSYVPFSSGSPILESSVCSKILTSQMVDGLDCLQPRQSLYSTDDIHDLNDFGLHDIENMDLRFNEPLCFPHQVTTSLVFGMDCSTRSLCDDGYLQYLNCDGTLQTQNSHLESQTEIHSEANGLPLARSGAFAQRRWTMIFSVLRWWFSVRRKVAKKAKQWRQAKTFAE